jgi:DNA-nicking Smr family endonuclease
MSEDPPEELPINGELDLHAFHPRDAKHVLVAYIDACLEKGITELRVVHGKGTGRMRDSVHRWLEANPKVRSFRLAGGDAGSWGATLVSLDPQTAS